MENWLLPVLATGAIGGIIIAAYGIAAYGSQHSYYSRLDRIISSLPILDCGVCGFPACTDFAHALASGGADPAGCVPGGPKSAHAIADILGCAAENGEPMTAIVHCKGGEREAPESATYEGIADCHAAILLRNGTKSCAEGCLGLGSCVRACPFGALSINDTSVAAVDRHACNGCGECIEACPRGLLSLVPTVHKIHLACNNHDRGEKVTFRCTVGCTACEKCVDITPSGGITMFDNLPRLDYYTPDENFVAAAYTCPSKCFIDLIKARPKANIDTKCDGCGACLRVCPIPGAITGHYTKRHFINKNLCIGCGRCLNSCHVRAISLWGSLGYDSGYKTGR